MADPPRNPIVTAAKYVALGLLAVGVLRIYPYAGEITLSNSVELLEFNDPWFVDVGLSRLNKMIRTESGARKVVEALGVKKCLALLNPRTEQKLIPKVLTVLERLSTFDSSRPSLKQEHVLEWIDNGVREGWVDGETCHRQLKTLRWELTRH